MRPEIEEYIKEQGWTFAGVSQPEHKRQWARVEDGRVIEVALEDDLADMAANIVEEREAVEDVARAIRELGQKGLLQKML